MAIVFNGLPWDRTDCLRFACSGHPPARIWNGQAPVAFEIDGESVLALAQAPSVGHSILEIEHGEGETPKAAARAVRSATIENERIRVLCDAAGGIRAIFGKDAGEEFLAATGALLVAQEDRGHFQIESPVNAEIPASAGSVSLLRRDPTPVRSRLALRGEFPALPWAGSDSHLKWEMELALYPPKNRLDMALRIDWKGEATRIRLKIPSNIDAAGGLFEIPFGVVERKPYRERGTARGEWPAMRFAAIETHDRGLALANTGVAGVEIAGGTLWTTLLRAPGSDSGNLVRDATSSQHGTHEFRFALVPYAGKDRRTEAIAAAQELNSPLLHSMRPCASGSANIGADSLRRSFLALSPSSVVLSSIKAPDDGAKEIAVRMYETMGVRTQAELSVPGAIRAWRSYLAEKKGKAVSCHNGKMAIAMKPFEIVTIRIALDSALAHP